MVVWPGKQAASAQPPNGPLMRLLHASRSSATPGLRCMTFLQSKTDLAGVLSSLNFSLPLVQEWSRLEAS